MRIIGGYLKGRKILNPIDKSTRPLKDMVRESIFNILEHSKIINLQLKNSNVLDLYSGVGSFGLECLSRNANQVCFFEKYIPTINILKKNVKTLGCENKCQIIESDVDKIDENIKLLKIEFNLVFLDPPFISKNINKIIDKIFEMRILSKDAIIVIHRNKNIKEKFTEKLKELRVERYGKSKIVFGIMS